MKRSFIHFLYIDNFFSYLISNTSFFSYIYLSGDIMNDIDRKRYLDIINKKKNNNNSDEKVGIRYLTSLGIRILFSVILFLVGAVLCKTSSNYKDLIYSNIYNTNFSFTKIKNIYDKYLGGVLPIDKVANNISPVFNEELVYTSKSLYQDGVKLEVSDKYLPPALESGLVVYVGEKENYGNTVIIQGIDGIDIWYGNMNTINVNLYDYIEKGSMLGEVNDKYLYLVYAKDGKFLNYEEYLK